jgi:hypothetical protein
VEAADATCALSGMSAADADPVAASAMTKAIMSLFTAAGPLRLIERAALQRTDRSPPLTRGLHRPRPRAATSHEDGVSTVIRPILNSKTQSGQK